jgi:uncharacterized integral membrane protein (TIGR00698 family)
MELPLSQSIHLNASDLNDRRGRARKIIFLLALTFCLSPLVVRSQPWANIVQPPVALALGIVVALAAGPPLAKHNNKWTKLLLQISVVGLGFGMDLVAVAKAGAEGLLFTAVSIVIVLVVGFFVGKWLKIKRTTSHLICSGTAICGGSAIAAVGKVLDADDKEMSASLGVIFILNSVALFLFPVIGHALEMTPQQFGMWAAIAIHDTSSVVGAATKYGADALAVATPVKLARTLWIVPLALLTAVLFRNGRGAVHGDRSDSRTAGTPSLPRKSSITIPWFVLYFVLASVLATYLPQRVTMAEQIFLELYRTAKIGLTVTLFLIGAGLSRATLKSVGLKPLVQGVLLWIVIALLALWAAKSAS